MLYNFLSKRSGSPDQIMWLKFTVTSAKKFRRGNFVRPRAVFTEYNEQQW